MKDGQDEREHLQLFDLIARDWVLPSVAHRVVFNNDATALAFDCVDGGVRIAATADKASPNSRMRRAADTARLTIAPRIEPVAALKTADYTTSRSSRVVAHGSSHFAFGAENGRINTTTPGGTSVYLPYKATGAVSVVAATAQEDGPLAYAVGSELLLHRTKTDNTPQLVTMPAEVVTLAFSPDGTALAIGHRHGTSIWTFTAGTSGFELDQKSTDLWWSKDGNWLACGLEAVGFALIDIKNQTAVTHENFTGPVKSAAFGADSDTVIVAGAFRVAAWDLHAPDKCIQTGKTGLTLIGAIASCPNRNLVAVGYANGLVSVARIGEPGEMLLRENTGAGIAALAWSSDGRFLGIAGLDCTAALVEFPDGMFKP
tara:strand:- start:4383 stop:5498 length:1116 start_codon:yes stop_codon:yes gene_type:complete